MMSTTSELWHSNRKVSITYIGNKWKSAQTMGYLHPEHAGYEASVDATGPRVLYDGLS